MGRLRIRKKKKKWGRRVSAGGHIFTFFDGPTDEITPSVNTSVNPSLIVTGHRHVTARTCFFKSLDDSVGIFWRCTCHVTRTDLVFKFIGDSFGSFDGEPVTSPVRVPDFESVSDSVGKITRQQVPTLFSLILTFPSVIRSVIPDGLFLSVITYRITDGNIPSVISTEKYR